MVKKWLVVGVAGILTSAALLVGQVTMAAADGVGASTASGTLTRTSAAAGDPCSLVVPFNSSIYNIYTPPAPNPNVLTFSSNQGLYNIYTPPVISGVLTFPSSQSLYNIYTPPAPNPNVLTFPSNGSGYNILTPCTS